jgi:O-antigen/teichoic acid export membrane protein
MISRILKLNKGLLYIGLGNLTGAIFTGGFWLLLATIQDPEEYGRTNYLVAIASLASFVALLGMNTTVTSVTAKGSKTISIQANQLTFISGFVLATLLSLLSEWYLGLFVLGMVFWMMSSYEFLGKKNYKRYSLFIIGARFSQLVLSLALYYVLGIPGVVIGFIISFLLFSYPFLLSIRQFTLKFDEVRAHLRFSLHAYSFNMSNAFLMYFDKLVIFPLFGYAVLGNYQISLQFLLFAGMIPVSLYQFVLSEESSGVSKAKLRLVGFGVSIILAAFLYTQSYWILENFFPNFKDSLEALRIISIGIIPMMFVWTTNSSFFSRGSSRYVAMGSGIYVSTQVALILLVGSRMGVSGLALAVDVALTAQAVFLYICQLRESGKPSAVTLK